MPATIFARHDERREIVILLTRESQYRADSRQLVKMKFKGRSTFVLTVNTQEGSTCADAHSVTMKIQQTRKSPFALSRCSSYVAVVIYTQTNENRAAGRHEEKARLADLLTVGYDV